MISNRSKSQALEVIHIIKTNRIKRIHTRGALDRLIEIVKFPHLKNRTSWGGRSLTTGKVTAYKNQQYDGIRRWLITQGYLTCQHDGYRYHYTLTNKNI